MRKIVNGKMYNTETAEYLAYYSEGNSYRDFRYFKESLYRKKTGEYFLAGEGGPLSPYAESDGPRSRCSGEGIKPLTIEEAKDWLESHDEVGLYIECFGEPGE